MFHVEQSEALALLLCTGQRGFSRGKAAPNLDTLYVVKAKCSRRVFRSPEPHAWRLADGPAQATEVRAPVSGKPE